MPADLFPLVDFGDMVGLVGPATYQRARAYSRIGAVSSVTWDDSTGMLSASVQGSAAWPYNCSVKLEPSTGEYRKPISSFCTCPVGANCKHVAAALLESNALHMAGLGGDDFFGGIGVGKASGLTHDGIATGSRSGGMPGGLIRRPAPEVPTLTGWKAAFSGLAPQPGASTSEAKRFPGSPPPTAGTHTPMALLFELREQTPRTRDRWRGPMAKPAGRVRSGDVELRLGVRPALLSATGNWVRGNITWNTMAFQSNRLSLKSEHQRWFAQFAALQKATRAQHGVQEADWLYLDDFQSPLLWRLLEDANKLGIPLVGAKKGSTVEVAGEARVGLDLTSDDGGGLLLTTVLAIDGEQRPVASASTIGEHGIYAWRMTPLAQFTIAPTPEPLTQEHKRLLTQEPVVVPAEDADEFMGEYFPRLRRTVTVTNSDASVPIPEVVPPQLVLTCTFTPKQSVKLVWEWEYTEGGSAERKRLWIGDNADGDRDPSLEAAVIASVERVLESGPLQSQTTLQGLGAAEFTDKVLPFVQQLDGVRVDIVGEKPDYLELTEAPTLKFTTVDTDDRDWFDLGVLVSIEGRKVPFAPLFKALSKGAKKLLLVDNSYLSLDHPAFEQLKDLIEEASALSEWDTGLRISRYQASLWAEFEDLADETEQAVSWRAAVQGLLELERVDPTPLPVDLRASLRPYQQDGFDWLAFLWAHGLGGVLADDMGLGKTLQTLALIAHAVEQQDQGADAPGRAPFLVVAPTSVVGNWLAEAERFTPTLVVRGITATEAKSARSLHDDIAGADIVVTSYALFRLDAAVYQAEEWSGLILDEAQFVKNPASKAHEAAVDLEAPFKLAITGTPMENSLTDLWSLFKIVAPGLFPSLRKFNDEYVKPIARNVDEKNSAQLVSRLRRRIRPLMMRRTKDLVATELPAKQEQVLRIDLSPRHKKLYDAHLQKERQKLLGLIDDMDKNRFIVFRSLTLLRMLALDASLVDEKYSDIPSSKLDALFEQLEDVVAEGHRALIFSQFTSFLKIAAARLDLEGVPYEYLDGSTLHRPDVIKRFKQGDAPVFLISLKAGGFGLNLTEADYVFMLDPWWNPASEAQAVDRTHRIGQTKSVMVYRMVARGTIEEKVMQLKEQKSKLFDAVMDDDAVFSSALTADDIRGLLEG